MIARRDSLTQALSELEAHTISGASTIVVSRDWWDGLSATEQGRYRKRAEGADVDLRVDETISSHFVEIRGGDEGPPLSTEHPM
jgi:hypothetical protein